MIANMYRHRVFEQFGEDEQERLEFDLDTFAVGEKMSHLRELYLYWRSLAGDGLPRADRFRPAEKLSGPALTTSAWVDTSVASPDGFVMHEHPEMPSGPFGRELTGVRLADFPVPMHADALIVEYARCRRDGRPMFHEIDQTIGGVSRAYRRIMLPLANERGEVVRVAYGYRFLREPEIVPHRTPAR